MSFEQEIFENNNSRRLNILKGFSDLDSVLGTNESELEKGFNSETQRTYADNSINRKLNRVGQKYGGRNEKDPVESEGKAKEDDSNVDKTNPEEKGEPKEVQPTQQYEAEQLQEFASSAEDWQLEEFLNDAKASGDNSEYMQTQMQIAQEELNSRRGIDGGSEEGVQEGFQENVEDGEEGVQEEGDGLPDWNDINAVKQFLADNPKVKERMHAILDDDIFIAPKDAIKLANAELKSGGDALKHVEAAKQTLDELHAKLGGSSEEGGEVGSIEFKPMEKGDRMGYADAPEDAVISHIGDNDAIYSANEQYLEIVYEDGNFKQFEGVSSQEEAMEIVKREVTSQEAQDNDAAQEENRNIEQEKPSTSPAGEPNRAENSEEEDEEDYEDSEDAITQLKREENSDENSFSNTISELNNMFSEWGGSWSKADPKTFDLYDNPNLLVLDSQELDDSGIRVMFDLDTSGYIIEDDNKGQNMDFSTIDDVQDYLEQNTGDSMSRGEVGGDPNKRK